jgi:hypothetical protein
MTDDDLRALTDQEMRNSVGYASGKLANMRQKAMWYYLGEAKDDLSPPEIEGRSKVVAPVVRNTIESMLPQLMVKFSGSERVVEFEPNKPGDEQAADQATDYINYLYHIRNDGELITYNWMKDALLSKNGFIKVWWDTRSEETREEYNGLNDIELAQLMDDEEVEVTEQKSYPDEEDAEQRQKALQQMEQQLQQATVAAQQGNQQAQQAAMQMQQQMQHIQSLPPKMLYDVVCHRTKKGGKICVENVPPEEFLISRNSKTIADARFVGHRVSRTFSDLKSMGYKDLDGISGDDQGTALNMERIERLSWDDELAYIGSDVVLTTDESQKNVWVTECYIRCDYDGDGISELRKVVRAGNKILDNEVCDVAPFVSITPVPMPHKFFGLSISDLAMESQRIETSLLRSTLDNTYLQVNGRYFAVEGQVNLDDLLTSRPGGIVRVKNRDAAGRLDQGNGDLQNAMNMLEYAKGFNEDSTGWTRYNQGTDGDSLNQTATGYTGVTNRADMRLDLIARCFATGFKDLFNMMLKLTSQYQQKEDVIKLRGDWVSIDPREWKNGFTTTVNVGLGTGDRDQQIKRLMAMLQEQKQGGLQMGIATPENVYNSEVELVKALGFKSADKFWTDPAKNPPPKTPSPEEIKVQGQMQIEQMKGQLADQQHQREVQADMQLEQHKQQMQAQENALQNQLEAQREQQRQQLEAQVNAHKAMLDAAAREQEIVFEKWKAELDAQTQIYVEQLKLGSKETPDDTGDMNNALAVAIDGFKQSLENMNRPRQIVRGPDGKAQGIV